MSSSKELNEVLSNSNLATITALKLIEYHDSKNLFKVVISFNLKFKIYILRIKIMFIFI